MSYPYGTPSDHKTPVGPVSPPLVRATAHAMELAEQIGQYGRGERHGEFYQRLGHRNGVQFEAQAATREGAQGAVAFSSGMAAMTAAILSHCGAGDRILVASQVYGGTEMLCREDLPRFGVLVERFDALELATLQAALAEPAALVVLETPINPTLRIVDLAATAAVCEQTGVPLILDGTFAPAPIQRALDFGVDLLVHSATKYYGGHSDALAGFVAGSHERLAAVVGFRTRSGAVLAPDVAWLLCRSMPTLDLRLSAQQASALRLAETLQAAVPGLDRLSEVWHPGLPGHPDHALAAAQMRGGPCLVSLVVAGGIEAACQVFERLRRIARAPSLGGVESVASLPGLTTHAGLSDEERLAAGIPAGILRISVGVEDTADLTEDLIQALDG